MSKPRIPNQKKKYNELNERLNKYVTLVQSIYNTLNLEVAKSVSLTGYSSANNKPFSFSDYPQTKHMIDNVQTQFVSDISSVIYSGISEEWKNSNHVQDLLVNSVLKSYGAKINKEKYKVLYQTNSDALKAFQNRKDKGFNISAKLWQQSTIYKKELEAAVSCAIQKGTSAVTLSKQISKYLLDFPSLQKDYKERFGNADHIMDCEYRSIRLARSEINMAYRSAENERWKQMDFVVGYEIKLSGKHPKYDVCDTLAGKYPKDFVWTGWHPNDLCYKIPILKTEDEFWDWDGRSSSTTPSAKEVKDVPDSFKSWVRENQDRIIEAKKRGTLPYFLKDNSELISPKDSRENYIAQVNKYTGSYYARINQFLRGQRKELDADASSVIEGVSKYIELSPKYEGISYRGIVADRSSFDFFKSFKKDSVFTEKGFMSTSINKLVADDFSDGTNFKIIFEVAGKKGVDVSGVSDISEEKEVLFDKLSKFKVKKIKVVDKNNYGSIYITMDEI